MAAIWKNRELVTVQYSMLGFALLALILGYIMSSFGVMLAVYSLGGPVVLFVAASDWAFFKRHPLDWFEPLYDDVPSTRQLRLLRQKQQQHKASVVVDPDAKSL